jgi:undecaprenyl-diphosphatase
MTHLTYAEAAIVGLLQGVTELFPVSSLGHSVLLPAIIGGQWARDLSVSTKESPYLAFIVGLHVATALALMIYFWREWIRIIAGFFTSIRHVRIQTADERLAWLIILGTIPVGIAGLALEHTFRVLLGKPIPASVFLAANGVILFGGERLRRNASRRADQDVAAEFAAAVDQQVAVGGRESGREIGAAGWDAPAASRELAAAPGRHASGHRAARQQEAVLDLASDRRLAGLGYLQGVLIGSAQVLALLAGISRSGVTMVAGLFGGLSHEDAARFAFLLATPVILAAGALKIPDLTGPLANGIHGQILVGSLLSGVGAYLSVRFLTRYFQTRTLTPFAIYCFAAGLGSFIFLTAA